MDARRRVYTSRSSEGGLSRLAPGARRRGLRVDMSIAVWEGWTIQVWLEAVEEDVHLPGLPLKTIPGASIEIRSEPFSAHVYHAIGPTTDLEVAYATIARAAWESHGACSEAGRMLLYHLATDPAVKAWLESWAGGNEDEWPNR